MGTYIIHFDDKPWEDLDDELYYRCFEIPWFSTTKTTISRLTPYTEDSAYAHGYTEAESKYREIRDELEKQAYQRGLNDAWECARKLVLDTNHGGLTNYEIEEIFGVDEEQTIINYSASEAIEKIRQYEQEKEEIQVGDEVIYNGTTTCVVFSPENDKRYASIIDADGIKYSADHRELTKTGRHFPEIAEVLQKMKETNNG